MSFPNPQFFSHDSLSLAYYEAGPKDGTPLVLVHGWPEIAYSWKPLFAPLTRAGYRVIAPDVRGFGRSDNPYEVEHYEIAQIVSDLEALLDHLGLPTTTLVGHDWGGIITWHAARMLRDRVTHIISLSTPHVRRAPVDPIKIFRARHGDEHYFVHFIDRPGEAENLFERHTEAFFWQMFQKTPPDFPRSSGMYHIPARFEAFVKKGPSYPKHPIMSPKDLQIYIEAYQQSGFHGGHNLYRNTTANWELAAGLSDHIFQPTLMLSARQDWFLPPELTAPMVEMVPDLTRHVIEDCGHWMMWEQPKAVSAHMLDWLASRQN